MLSNKEAIEALMRHGIRELSQKDKKATEETLFTNRVFSVFFMKLLIHIENDLPIQGFFQQSNKEALIKYRNAVIILKAKIKKEIDHGR